MTIEEAIQQLEFDREMILFDPTTGETITPEVLKIGNQDNYRTYLADEMAIEALKEIRGRVPRCGGESQITGCLRQTGMLGKGSCRTAAFGNWHFTWRKYGYCERSIEKKY